ncbi:hypothetical protein M5D96_010799 [Drosophila gunungcola]|uniref:Uncharacterized protein n=1 Tax=Drosophila gunungcola TaxID=103775 RepID=A0A9P9YGG5_9MUSC|nr:hypothetical protein M5D96_010799 [Drosophila gunungcola]
MNFLKPGSAETLTRPVYIFEYLPPMQDPEPREIQTDTQKEFSQKQFDVTSSAEKLGNNQIDSLSPNAVVNFPSNAFDSDTGRSVREMSSVVMTTGGFISPAIEGKLPEAFIPDIIDTVFIKKVENNLQSSNFPTQHGTIQQSPISLSAKKTPCEPERNKLDIFKKISKPRTSRQDGGAITGPPGMGVRNQAGMVPLLPLLHFPPRPGLIPSGPGLFPAVTGLVGFGNIGNRVGMAPIIAFPGPDGSVADTARCPQIKDSSGITFAPKDNDDWFCRVCVTKKRVHGSEKKKKRNKKK